MISRQPTASHSSLIQQPIASHWSIVEEVVRWWEEEEEVVLVTTKGEERRVSGRVLALHSPLLASILGEVMAKGTRVMVEASLSTLSSLLTLLTRGEVQLPTSTLGEEVLQLARELGVALGQVSSCQGPTNFSFGPIQGLHCMFDTIGSRTDLLLEEEEVFDVDGNQETKVEGEINLTEDQIVIELPNPYIQKAPKHNQLEDKQCDHCPKLFRSTSTLKLHSMFHSKFHCYYCDKRFKFSSMLRKHMDQCVNMSWKSRSNVEFSSQVTLRSIINNFELSL